MVSRGIMAVPTFLVGDEVVVGLDIPRLEKLLGSRVLPCPGCSKKLRVPEGKGAIQVTCPRCSHRFETRT